MGFFRKGVSLSIVAVVLLSACTAQGAVSEAEAPASVPVAVSASAVVSSSVPEEPVEEPVPEEPVRPSFPNVLEEARYLQTLPEGEARTSYGDYIFDLDPSAYETVAQVYAHENQIPFRLVEAIPVETLEEGIPEWYANYVDYDPDNFAFWKTIPWRDPDKTWPYIIPEDHIDTETDYLFYSVNREIEHISVFFDDHGDPDHIPEYYSFGTMTPDYPRRSAYYDALDEYERQVAAYERAPDTAPPPPNPPMPALHMCLCNPDSIRAIYSSTYTPDTLYLYAIPHSAPPFNITSYSAQGGAPQPPPGGTPVKSGNLYWEYAQIEVA